MPPPSSVAIIPGRPLRRLPVALEYPITKLAAHRDHAAEEAGIAQHLELEQARQEQLVLHHAVLHAGLLRELAGFQRGGEIGRDRLLAIDMLAMRDRLFQKHRAHLRGAGIEEHFVIGIEQRLVEIGGPAGHAVLLRQRGNLVRVAPDQDRVRHHAAAVRQYARRPHREWPAPSGSDAGSCPCARSRRA